MKGYKYYMDKITVDPELHERIMRRVSEKPAPIRRRHIVLRYAVIAACMAALLFLIWLIPGFLGYPHITGDPNRFENGLPDSTQNGGQGGHPALMPQAPSNEAQHDEMIPLDKARNDPEFGAFLPAAVPVGFSFEVARRDLNQNGGSLFAVWHRGLDTISWLVRAPSEFDLLHVVSADDRYKYDVSLYPEPWADSVPDEIYYYFQSPVFLAEEFSLDVIHARTLWVDSSIWADPFLGDTSGWQTSQFGVLFGDVLVEVSMSGVPPEQIWAMMPPAW